MRTLVCGGLAVALTSLSFIAGAAPLEADDGAIGGVLRTLKAPGATEAPVIHQTDEGFIRFLGAPPGGEFIVRDDGSKALSAPDAAETFVKDHGSAFGVVSDSTQFKVGPVREHHEASFVHLDQYYGDLPVFGGQVVVQVSGSVAVQNVLSDIMRDTRALDDASISLTPTVSAPDAVSTARRILTTGSLTAGDFVIMREPELTVYRPSVLGLEGATRLVWRLELAAGGEVPVHEAILLDAHSGQVALQFSLVEGALDRQILDANGGATLPDTPTRVEGDPDTGIEAVDNVYEFLGDTYNFFLEEHDYDSFDDQGSTIVATVNVPFLNACWGCSLDPGSTQEGSGDITEMLFGIGLGIDDIVAHELTHGVTQFTSDLIYFGYSGAINESFSDMWGEWVDQTNGSANDTAENRWIIGEDLDPAIASLLGGDGVNPGIRNMKDPTIFGDPDRLNSPLLIDPNSFFDNGGVHINSGIGNKLCYLLTDGGTFNGQTVEGFGISMTADLFFGTQFLLSPASDYNDLFLALGASAVSLGFNLQERLNIVSAGTAVEIVPEFLFDDGLRDFRAISTTDTTGNPVVALNWTNPGEDLFDEVILLRSSTGFPTGMTDGELLAEGAISQYLDTSITDGVTYYYSVIADLTSGLPQRVTAQATAGAPPTPILTESFRSEDGLGDGSNALDLAFSQIIYTPVGPPPAEGGLGNYSGYEATFHPNAFALPVPREDSEGTAFDVTSPQDSGVIVNLGSNTFPYFGQHYSQLYVAANGYISFEPVGRASTLNFASLSSHFAIPRISYLFAGAADIFDRLASSAGGSLWLRLMDDRIVVTYENVPQVNPVAPENAGATSTVQTELFHSGTIRITYLDAVATAAVVGLSDGRGVPVDPSTLFPGIVSAGSLADLSQLPAENSQLYLMPTPTASGAAGSLIEFTVTAVAPPESAATPTLTGTWNGPGGLRFADNGDGTGTFSWQTTQNDVGTYRMRVVARGDGQVAYQDITIQVGDVVLLPAATDLALITDEPGEDPTQDRAVRTESFLTASYAYSHPLQGDSFSNYDEGRSKIYWYRNDQIVTGLTNRDRISPQATRGGDRWYFGVVPVSLAGLSGPIAYSPVVTVSAIPEIISVTPALGGVMGGETVTIRGTRLGAPISVTFGGTPAQSIASVSADELEVVTPLHAAGVVDVVVRTTTGDGLLAGGYTYLGPGDSVAVTDVNGDGKIDALDVQLVVNAVLGTQTAKQAGVNPDANRDGRVNSSDIQVVVNSALIR